MSRDYDVVIPTHGRNPALLLEAVDSVLGQTVPPVRVIVVADGCPATARLLRERRPTVSVLEHAEARGEAAARQTGIEAASSSWITFLDDDDLWSPRKQQVLLEYVEQHPECEAVRSGYWMFSASPSALPPIFGQQVELVATDLAGLEQAITRVRPRNDLSYLDIEGCSLELMLERNRGVIGTSMVRRSVLARTPAVPPGLRPGADYLLFCHVAALTEWHLVPRRLAYYRVHPEQDTRRGGAEASLGLLRAKQIAWEVNGASSRRALPHYGGQYAAELRQLVWGSARQGRLVDAARVYRAGLPLLPRTWHRLLAAVPEPLAWRARQLRRLHRSGHGGDDPSW